MTYKCPKCDVEMIEAGIARSSKGDGKYTEFDVWVCLKCFESYNKDERTVDGK